MNSSTTNTKTCDPILGIVIGALIIIGIVMVYSSSAVYALEEYKDPYYFLKRQVLWVIIGFVALRCTRNIDYRLLEKYAYPILLLAFLLLLAVMIPGMGKEVGGARRWLSIGGFNFQPSEIAKITLVIFIAKSLVKRSDQLKNFAYGYLPNIIVLGFFFIPILFQPDFGTAMIIGIVAISMLFIAGIRTKFLVYSVLAVIPLLVSAVTGAEYRMRRILAFLDPWQDPSDSGFQAIQSFYAFGRGGIWGVGLGDGSQKLFYLPEAHTDFIFSVIGEELGFVGAMAIVALFCIFIWRGFSVALNAKDAFGTNVAIGLTLLIGIQAFTNMGVAIGLLPTKGLTLPFISMGGSSLVAVMIASGVLLNISERPVVKR
ncbi:MAG: putative lipid II flippase FtsW [Candidatus Nitrohelix vancouverensis]|uniref:Probable peptidoglycan glycosyltransferase FtsW n=1 Tax=Candidatus Nitrohelix vancouverensis TaxID=2705534 RepID=A0A7T0C4X7_9BACT|nr:MAG: putative lipid II flippase FtsW [Candidatus Nitrohelix vancouverensis]